MSKGVLLIAFDFPPCQSPGVERTLRFAHYLESYGWSPTVLTVCQSTFGTDNLIDDNQFSFPVYRTFCLDVSKHLAYRGKYFGWMKKPDRYVGWSLTAIPKAIRLIRRLNIDVVWSTYPLLTSHLIGLVSSCYTKVPWVADYRDPLQCHYDKTVYNEFKFHRWLERKIIARCSRAVFTTLGASKLYQNLYNKEDKFVTIENGIEENLINSIKVKEKPLGKCSLLHLGSLYKNGRDTRLLFEALGNLKKRNIVSKSNFELFLVGCETENYQTELAKQFDVVDLLRLKKKVSHNEALGMLQQGKGLLLVQNDIFNLQIPSKVYEYLATNAFIIALTPHIGDTGQLLAHYNGCVVAESAVEVECALEAFVTNASGELFERDISALTRKRATQKLALLLDKASRD